MFTVSTRQRRPGNTATLVSWNSNNCAKFVFTYGLSLYWWLKWQLQIHLGFERRSKPYGAIRTMCCANCWSDSKGFDAMVLRLRYSEVLSIRSRISFQKWDNPIDDWNATSGTPIYCGLLPVEKWNSGTCQPRHPTVVKNNVDGIWLEPQGMAAAVGIVTTQYQPFTRSIPSQPCTHWSVFIPQAW